MNAYWSALKGGAVLLASLVIAGCVSPVVIDHQAGVDYSRYQSYTLSPRTGAWGESRSLDRQRVEAALRTHLASEGLTPTAPEQADVLVDYFFKIEQHFEGSAVQFGVGVFHHPVGFTTTTPVEGDTRNEYKLVVQLVEPANRDVIWQATSRYTLHDEMSTERRIKRINDTVADMFENYPPTGG